MPAFTLYIGIDWATQTHQVCVMDACGKIVREFVVHHTGESVREFLRSLEAAADEPCKIAVAIEVPRGPIVEALWSEAMPYSRSTQSSWTGFATGTRWRAPKTIGGTRSCWPIRCERISIASGGCPSSLPSRAVTRTSTRRAGGGEELRRAANQLFQLLLRYYPQILNCVAFRTSPGSGRCWKSHQRQNTDTG